MVVVDCLYGNSNNFLINKGDWFVYLFLGIIMLSILEFIMFNRLKRNVFNKIKLDSML